MIFKIFENIYSNKSIYLLNYPQEKEVVVSYDQPPKIINEGIKHKCQTQEGSSGSPILLANNQKVIGIHYGAHKTQNFNLGLLIIYPIIEFNQKEIIQKKMK
jgi:V8-like Glu-specific endopeptidase